MNRNCKIEGARAFAQSVARHACPYAAGSMEFEDWMDGWAQQKASDERSNEAHEVQKRFSRAG